MLVTENEVFVESSADIVYALSAEIPRWPEILSHYRYVRVLDDPDESATTYRRRVKMGALRGIIPVNWTASQVLRPADNRVVYHHIGGVTKGMDVEWRIEERGGGVRVTIYHSLTSPRFWLRSSLTEYIVGTFFVHHIAQKTLEGIKSQAEAVTRGRLLSK